MITIETKTSSRTSLILGIVLFVGVVGAAAYLAVATFQIAASSVSATQVIDAGMVVANSMDLDRKVPAAVNISGTAFSHQDYLKMAVVTLQALLSGSAVWPNIETPASLTAPSTLYSSIDLLSTANVALYSKPLLRDDYKVIIDQLGSSLTTSAPSLLTLSTGGQIRYPEALYLVSGLLRYYKFFGKLPLSYNLYVISPQGLVSWTTPVGYEQYTSTLDSIPSYVDPHSHDSYLYPDSANSYDIFKLAKTITAGITNINTAGKALYDYVHGPLYTQVGYFGYSGGGSFNLGTNIALDWLRNPKGTSGVPRYGRRALFRVLGIPENEGEMAYINNAWVNIDQHSGYGSDPMCNSFDYQCTSQKPAIYSCQTDPAKYTCKASPYEPFVPNPTSLLATKVKNLIIQSQATLPSANVALFINPTDIDTYGVTSVVDKAKKGGFSTLILAVKNNEGDIFFNTTDSAFVKDSLTSLLSEGHAKGLKVYAGLAALMDYRAGKQHPDWLQKVYSASDSCSGSGATCPPDFISPCVFTYRTRMKNLVRDVSRLGVDGVVVSEVYYGDASKMDNNSACLTYNVTSTWKESLITTYTGELYQTVRDNCAQCDFRTVSWPLGYSQGALLAEAKKLSAQDFTALSRFGSGIIMPYRGNRWLVANDSDYFFTTDVQTVKTNSGITPGVALYFVDEWDFPAEYYNGLIQHASRQGVSFISFYTPGSMEGKFGPAFTASQWQKISEVVPSAVMPVSTAGSTVRIDDVLVAAHQVANAMEGKREIPASVSVDGQILTPAQYFRLSVSALKMLLDSTLTTGSTLLTVPGTVAEPATPYATVNLLTTDNVALYSEPMKRAAYQQLVNALDTNFFVNNAATSMLVYQNGQIRYPEAMYFVSNILRERLFFGRMPASTELFIISPRGLIPWSVPAGYESYVDATKTFPGAPDYVGFYNRTSHYYQVYKFARNLVSGISDTYTAGQKIYDWSKYPGWFDVGYGTKSTGFGFLSSTWEEINNRRGTSGLPYVLNEGLMRAVNLPNDGALIYLNGMGWRNIDNHIPYGVDPSLPQYIDNFHAGTLLIPPLAEVDHFPQLDHPWITAIKGVSAKASAAPLSAMTAAIFVNPGDLMTYGPQYIVDQAAAGGLNTIIATVKSVWGSIYFNSKDSLFRQDLLTPLLSAARVKGLKVYAALPVLADNRAVNLHPDWKEVNPVQQYPLDAVSPCVTAARTRIKNLITELTINYSLDGIVLADIHMGPQEDNNSACSVYRTSTNWREALITQYTTDIVSHAQTTCPSCQIRVMTSSVSITGQSLSHIQAKNWNSGNLVNQNLDTLSLLGNGLLIPFAQNGWLLQSNYYFPTVARYFKDKGSAMPGVSLYWSGEWEFTPEFYNGILQHAATNGITFVSFHTNNSLGGEFAGADRIIQNTAGFTKAQLLKFSSLGVTISGQAQPSCTPVWTCTNWSVCAYGSQSRTCSDSNNCGTILNRPLLSQTCTVSTPNRAPVANAGPDQTVLGGSTVGLNGTLTTDPDGDSLFYSWTLQSGPLINLTGSQTGQPSFQSPIVSQSTSMIFVLSVSDGKGGTSQDTVTITLTAPPVSANHSPVFSPVNTINGSEGVALSFMVAATDPDGEALTYINTNAPLGATFNPSTRTFSWTPNFSQAGIYSASFVVSDPRGGSAQLNVTISISDVNRLPIANAGLNQTVLGGTTVTVNGTGSSDLDGDALSYVWSQVSGPVIILSNANQSQTMFQSPVVSQNTSITLQLAVTDSKNGRQTDTVLITLTPPPNRAPVWTSVPVQTITEDQDFDLVLSATDVNQDILTYASVNIPSGSVFTPSTRTFHWKPSFTQAGTYTADFTVTDGKSAVIPLSVSIIVSNKNRAPVITTIPAQTGSEGVGLSFVVSAVDPDGDSLAYLATAYPFGATFDTVAKKLSWTPTFAQAGKHSATIRVQDSAGLSATQDVAITITDVNRQPTANAGPDINVFANTMITLDATASADPDADTLVFAWTKLAGPNIILSAPSTARPNFTAPNVTAQTVLTLQLTVSDGKGGSSIDVLNVTLMPQPVAPSVLLTRPQPNEVVSAGTVNVLYEVSGDLQSYDHVALQLDSRVAVTDKDGSYTFNNVSSGTHTIKITLARLDNTLLANPEATKQVIFSVNIPICQPNWQCGAWGVCSSTGQQRTCLDLNSCNSQAGKPVETQECTVHDVVFVPRLEGKSDTSGNKVTLKFVLPQTTSVIAELTLLAITDGKITLPIDAVIPEQSYDIVVMSAGYLTRRLSATTVASNNSIDLPQLESGDFNNDNIINSIDFSLLNARWFLSDAVVDINADGIVNSIDFSFLNKNWNKIGD